MDMLENGLNNQAIPFCMRKWPTNQGMDEEGTFFWLRFSQLTIFVVQSGITSGGGDDG